MITFWVVSALLMAGALLFVVPPLLGGRIRKAEIADHQVANLVVLRDQLRELEAERASGEIDEAQYTRAKAELEQRVLEESVADSGSRTGSRPPIGLIAAIVLFVPTASIPLYLYLGTPAALNPAAVAAQAAAQDGSHELTAEQVQAMVEKLAARLRENPDDAEGWVMLARTYNALGQYDKAAQAFATLTRLLPADAQLLADYADTLAMARGRSLSGEPEAIIARALELDARNVKALALAGSAAFERSDYAKAIEYWQRIASQVDPNSPTARSVAGSIAEARKRLAAAGGSIDAPLTASVTGRVDLTDAVKANANPEHTVFVFARAVDGPRMPLAIVRKQVKDLPFDFTLDDSMAMTPAARLSGFPQVVVGARISQSGNASPQPGDVEAFSPPLDPASGTSVSLILGGESGTAKAGPPKAGLTGTVTLDPDVADKVAPGDTVFIFARAAQGPRIPLAILRKRASDLPVAFTLDDSMAMTPNMRLSSVPEVIVGARVSKSGNAMPQPGDFEALSEPVRSNASGLTLVIATEVR
ncbi:MAG: c-type cytochrome biogenesis protein CcmI [Rhodocyclaceae bacterium]|nr:c-type cytochrome biogenesis protein CcmI [Rhodocyclaceae bacterium]